MSIASNIKKIRERYDLTQDELGEIAGVSGGAVSTWERGTAEPRMGAIQKIADYFKISKAEIVDDDNIPPIDGYAYTAIPVYGRIPAGGPAEAIEYQEGVIYIPAEEAKDNNVLALKVSGDSMYPEYKDGDIVVIRRQSDCENGQDCAVRINGYDATLKKVLKEDKGIILQPINPEYKAQYYTFDNSTEQVEIIGIVTEVRRKKI